METRTLPDGSLFCFDPRGACHLHALDHGVVLHVGHGVSPPELAKVVIKHCEAQVVTHGYCVCMVDGTEVKMTSTAFRDAMTEWYKTRPRVKTHVFMRSSLLAMGINIANLFAGEQALKAHTNLDDWLAVGRAATPKFARRPFGVPAELRGVYHAA